MVERCELAYAKEFKARAPAAVAADTTTSPEMERKKREKQLKYELRSACAEQRARLNVCRQVIKCAHIHACEPMA